MVIIGDRDVTDNYLFVRASRHGHITDTTQAYGISRLIQEIHKPNTKKGNKLVSKLLQVGILNRTIRSRRVRRVLKKVPISSFLQVEQHMAPYDAEQRRASQSRENPC